MDVNIEKSWKEMLQKEFNEDYFLSLVNFVREEYRNKKVFPPGGEIFRAFDKCSFDDVRVVIIGQDPYHGPGQANGLCFSVRQGIPFPPSLINIFQEIKNETGREIPASGDLERWAHQGVLLLNATLTVRANIAGSHQNKGWETFTDAVIRKLSDEKEFLVFILWGSYAQQKGKIIDTGKHLVLKSPHPSPLSAGRGFFGNGHFVKANNYLRSKGIREIEW